jgi:2-polyprenyl-3-methyl-5-hydroxy-6-metoxy-1,4-benzoquinol methylase
MATLIVDRALADCPLCLGQGSELFRKQGHRVLACTSCKHRFAAMEPHELHYDEVYSDDYFQGSTGAGYPDYVQEAEMLRKRGRWYAELLGQYMPPGHLLDVGAAAGYLSDGFHERGWSGMGVEPNQAMAMEFERRLDWPAYCGPLERLADESYLTEQFDLINMIQVVGHFVDPATAFHAAATMTAPGGWWLLESWDSASWTARMFGRHWHEYSPPSVVQFFSRAGLTEYLSTFGLETIVHGRPPKGLSVAHAASLLEHCLPSGVLRRWAASVCGRLPGDWMIPYPGRDLFWMLLRKTE